jgi:transcriptional regulator with XRE-family HTH domain
MVNDGLLATLRRAIRDSDLSQAEIARRIGVSRSLVCTFVSGDKGMAVETLDALADVLGLRLVPAPKSRSKRRK